VLTCFSRHFLLFQGPGYDGKKLVGSLDAEKRFFDFEKLAEVTRVVTRNLNKIIDVNYYPTETARRSNMRHRPIGLGVQVCRCAPAPWVLGSCPCFLNFQTASICA
jgi:hypothetical protein